MLRAHIPSFAKSSDISLLRPAFKFDLDSFFPIGVLTGDELPDLLSLEPDRDRGDLPRRRFSGFGTCG